MLVPSEYCANYIDNNMQPNWYPPARANNNMYTDPRYDRVIAMNRSNRNGRNLAEKQRRDRLNSFISELASLVPMVARSPKRMDKTSILRLAATYLRIYHTLQTNNLHHMQLPKQLDQYLLEQLVCDQLGGFLLILTPNGKIVFVSQSVEQLLAHLQTDLMGQSLFNITAPEDHERLRTHLMCEGIVEAEWRKYFSIRLKRAGPRTESPVYETVKLMGMARSLDSLNTCNSPSLSPGSSRGLLSPSSSTSSSSFEIMVFFVKICRPEPLADKLLEASKDEYVTRHLIDGRIISCDQRISLVAGYMIDEVSGMSAFKYMHKDDVRWVMIALRQMYDRGESRGSSCYRLISRNGQFIYLKTFGFLEIDDQGIVESFVCVNVLVDEGEGRHLINEMKKKFSALIAHSHEQITNGANGSTLDKVEDPREVDQAIAHLMMGLPSANGNDHRSTPSPRIHYKDCNTTNHQQYNPLTEPTSPVKPIQMRYKTANKRAANSDDEGSINTKRLKSPQESPVRCQSPFNNGRPQVTDRQHTESI